MNWLRRQIKHHEILVIHFKWHWRSFGLREAITDLPVAYWHIVVRGL